MASRSLDPIKRGLRLAFSSWKLIRIILSMDFNFFSLIFIYRANITSFEPYYFMLATILSFIAFTPFYKKLRLRISLSFKIALLVSTVMNLLLLFWVQQLLSS